MLILHYTGMRDARSAIERLRSPEAAVSAHYVVDEDGTIYRLVEEAWRAQHAGVSFWRGAQDLNDRSIGIEIVNPGHEWGYRDFPDAQIAAVIGLCGGILARYPIPARNVIGHSDVAPDRKKDPGERFPWERLAAAGIGLWPADGDEGVASEAVAEALARIGYGFSPTATLPVVLAAFQRHWRPSRVDGFADAETRLRLGAVLRAAGDEA
jgi:N-acetylmuramoyl-L-alanine amidase